MNTRSFSLGVIGGGGRLGSALVSAVLDAGLVDIDSLTLSRRSDTGKESTFPEARWTADNQVLADASDIIVVSVRPEHLVDLQIDVHGKTVISLMAGIPVRVLSDRLGTARVVRAMPNAAAEIRRSYTPWFATDEVPPADKRTVHALFACCGVVDEVRSEALIDYLSGLTGSGPAFPALLADAMIRDAVARGLGPDVARRAVEAVVVEASRLVAGKDPSEVVSGFLDYRGTTAAAIETMLEAGFQGAIRAGLRAAEARAEHMWPL